METFEQQIQKLMTTLQVLAELQTRQGESLLDLTASITRYVDSSNLRMERMETNLDALIQAITAEHSNGKAKP